MSTRSLTIMMDNDWEFNKELVDDDYKPQEICVMYRQFDGYPDNGHGEGLANFLNGIHVVNGIGFKDPQRIANGCSCLAAQIIAYFKFGPGSFYLYPAGTRGYDAEWVYTVSKGKDNKPHIKVENIYAEDSENPLFEGNPQEMLIWIEEYKQKCKKREIK